MRNFNVESLLFVDDLKLYLRIQFSEDCCRLQANIDALVDWCDLNEL